jgi:tetratricopeptide (TPR) repeat protein
MSDRRECPKCKEQALTDTHYSLIRNELILCEGRCVNCGYEITAETLYEQLRNEFDLEKEFEHLEELLDYILTKLKSTEEEPGKSILSLFVKVYGEKIAKATDDKEVEKYLNRMISHKTYSKEQIYVEFAKVFMNKDKFRQAAGYFEKALALHPTNFALIIETHLNLSLCYAFAGQYNKAVEVLDVFCRGVHGLGPLTGLCHLLKFACLIENGQYKEAIEFGRPLSLPPEFAGMKSFVHNLLLRAFVKVGDLENALAEFDDLVASDPDFFSRLDFSFFVDNPLGFEVFCSAVFTLLKKDIIKAYALVRQIDIDQLKEDCDEKDSVEYAPLVIFVSFLKATVYCDYFFAGDKKEQQLLKDAQKYLGFSIDTWRVWQSGEDLAFDSYPPREIWESCFGNADRIQPEAHILMGKIYETFGDYENAFVEYKKAAEYQDYASNEDLVQKIEETKLKLGGLADKLLKQFFITLPHVPSEEEQDAQERILSILSSIRGSFPDVEEMFKKEIKLHGLINPNIFLRARLKVDELVDEMKEQRIGLRGKHIVDSRKSKTYQAEEFYCDVWALKKAGIIDNYIMDVLLMIFAAGSAKARHYKSLKTLEFGDVELLLMALCRFLNWYSKNFPK